jgi:hypothetical protein
MNERRFNFARRPFRDDRPVFLAAGIALGIAAVLLVANVRLYSGFQHEISGTAAQIEALEARRARAAREGDAARTALNNYRVSSLARESQALLRLVGERRFSWTGLMAALERALPSEVRVSRMTPAFDAAGDASMGLGLVGKSPESVVRTLRALASDPAFDRVELRTEASAEGGGEGHSFEISVGYRGSFRR